MIKTVNNLPTESKRFSYFSTFKSSKRVRWSEARNYVY